MWVPSNGSVYLCQSENVHIIGRYDGTSITRRDQISTCSWQCSRLLSSTGLWLVQANPTILVDSGCRGRRNPPESTLPHRLTCTVGPKFVSSIGVGCLSMIQCRLLDNSSGESLKEMPRRCSRMYHTVATCVFRLVAGLRVGVPGVVLELIGCGMWSAWAKAGGVI
jgi:hypothetical protein